MVEWKTQRLPKDLLDRVEKIMNEVGYNSKSDFISDAVRDLLDKHEKNRFEHTNFDDDVIKLIDNHKPRGNPFVEIVLNGKELHCKTCQSKACEHIEHVWQEPKIRRQLKETGFKPV